MHEVQEVDGRSRRWHANLRWLRSGLADESISTDYALGRYGDELSMPRLRRSLISTLAKFGWTTGELVAGLFSRRHM